MELLTDQELLKRHQDVIKREKHMTENLRQKVQSNSEVNIDLVRKEKELRLKRAHDKLVKREAEERSKIQRDLMNSAEQP